MPQAQGEAQAAFGDGGLYIEKVIAKARHIEVQVLGDGERAIHCFERECSLQRRRQKVWEEAPSPVLPDDGARRSSAPRPWRSPKRSTIAAPARSNISMTMRRQRILFHRDEHPHPGRASGDRIHHRARSGARDDPASPAAASCATARRTCSCNGHAIEVRINAEDPAKNFMPFPGTVGGLSIPGGPGTRFDTMLYDGYQVPPFYDSLLGKLIVWDETREHAIARMKRALGELEIGGLKTTKPLHHAARRRCRGAGRAISIRAGSSPGSKPMPQRLGIHDGGGPINEDPIFLWRR